MESPRIPAYDIHEWIFTQLRLEEDEVLMVHIDGIQRVVYIKLQHEQRLMQLLQTTQGHVEFRHSNGEISTVQIDMAGPGLKRIRIAHLPPEVSEQEIRVNLAKYGAVQDIQNEVWSRRYRYHVLTGVRIVSMALKTHVPSKTTIAGHRVMVAYEGQPLACFKCNESGHYHQECRSVLNVTRVGIIIKNALDAGLLRNQAQDRGDILG
jgi:hypothetical protein